MAMDPITIEVPLRPAQQPPPDRGGPAAPPITAEQTEVERLSRKAMAAEAVDDRAMALAHIADAAAWLDLWRSRLQTTRRQPEPPPLCACRPAALENPDAVHAAWCPAVARATPPGS